jgi:hypothetical protein
VAIFDSVESDLIRCTVNDATLQPPACHPY